MNLFSVGYPFGSEGGRKFYKFLVALFSIVFPGTSFGANAFCVGGPLQANFAYAQWPDAVACAQTIIGRGLADAALLHLGNCTSNMVNVAHPASCDLARPAFYGPWESRKHVAELIFSPPPPPANPTPVFVDAVLPDDGSGGMKSLGNQNEGATVVNVNGVATLRGPYAHLLKLVQWDGSDLATNGLSLVQPSGESHSNLTNLTLYVQHQAGVPSVNGWNDAPFYREDQRMLISDAVTRITQVLQRMPDQFIGCVDSTARSEFQNNHGIRDGFTLVNTIRQTLFDHGFLLIGGFSYPPNPPTMSMVTGYTWSGFGTVNYSPNGLTPVAPRSIHRLNVNTHPYFFRQEKSTGPRGNCAA